MKLRFSSTSLQRIFGAVPGFPLGDTLQHGWSDVSIVAILRCKNHTPASECRSRRDLQSSDDDVRNEAAFERKDNAPFCKNHPLVMKTS